MSTRKLIVLTAAIVLGALTGTYSEAATAGPICEQPLAQELSGSSPTRQGILDTCDPGGGGITPSPTPSASNITIGDQCSLPGPYDDNRCTVLFHVRNNPANYIICLWSGNSLVSCEGRVLWGGGFDFVTAPGVDVEFRHHTVWPTQDPAWPNAQLVRTKGLLLKSQHIVARYRSSPNQACNVTVSPGASIQAAINTGSATICLAPGLHATSSSIVPRNNQTVRGSNPSDPAVIRPNPGYAAFEIQASNVTLKDLVVDRLASQRSSWGVLVYGGNNVLLDRIKIYRSIIPLGVTEGASNVELRDSYIAEAGDGLACEGCASPSIWINNSSDVRVFGSVLINNGVGPQGDGELACYNSPNVVIQNSTVTNSGASGMYLVNCDRIVVIGNLVQGSKEWGLDIVETGQPSGTDYGLFQWNRIENSRNGGVVLRNSLYNTFSNNTYTNNRQGGSGSCNGVNRRNNTTGFYQFNDVGNPWPVYCND